MQRVRIHPGAKVVAVLAFVAACTSTVLDSVPVATVQVIPATADIGAGQTVQLDTRIQDDQGRDLKGRQATWSSGNAAIATVSGTGLVMGVAEGQATITASVEGVTGRATIQVAARQSIQLDPASLAFEALTGGGNPPMRQVKVTSAGEAEVSGVSITLAYGTGEPGGWVSAGLTSSTTPLTINVSAGTQGLAAGTYHGTVEIRVSGGVRAEDLPVTLTVMDPATTGPTNLRATVISNTRIDLAWNDNSQDETAFRIERRLSSSSEWQEIGTVGPNVTTYAAAGLTPSTAYAFRVRACNDGGCSVYSNEVTAATLGPVPASPSGLTATAVSPREIDLVWADNSPNELEFRVERLNGTTWSPLATVPSNTTRYEDGSVAPASTYNYRVAACNTGGCSPFSNEASATTPALPAIGLSSTGVVFSATEGGANPLSRNVQVTNIGGQALDGLAVLAVRYRSGQPGGWLEASLSGSTAPATLTLSATTGTLAEGTYNAEVDIASAVASNSPQTIGVTFNIGPTPPSILLDPATVTFAATAGGADPTDQTVDVQNGGVQALTGLGATVASYGDGQPTGWLSASLSGPDAPATLTLSAATAGLAAGTYDAVVEVASAVATNSPQTVAVTFNVAEPPPAIVLSRAAVSFSASAGGAAPADETVDITNGGGGSLSGLGATVTFDAGASDWLTASLDVTDAPATLTLSVTNTSLLPGTYTAHVSVASAVAGNSPQVIDVTYTLGVGPVIGLSPNPVAFAATKGGADPAPVDVTIGNDGLPGLLGISVAAPGYGSGEPTGWLGVSPTSLLGPGTITLTATVAGLNPGTYHATVTVSALDAPSADLTVTFAVAPPSGGLTPPDRS